MTTYFVGPGGNNGNSGLSWALRRLTLTSIETLVVAGDTVYIGPGTYRELLTTTANGSAGSPISYIADVTGINTDGVGGVVRITASDNDQTSTRAGTIICANNYRTFQGFWLDGGTSQTLFLNNNTNNILQDLFIQAAVTGLVVQGAAQANHIVRRCIIWAGIAVNVTHTATLNNVGHLFTNLWLVATVGNLNFEVVRVGGFTLQNSLIWGGSGGVRVLTALAAGQTVTVNNCILMFASPALQAVNLGEITENYNNLYANGTLRTNVGVGANSQVYTPLLGGPILSDGILTWLVPFLSAASPLASIVGTGVPADDLYGTTRVATSSWGPTQYIAGQRPVDSGEPRGRRGT